MCLADVGRVVSISEDGTVATVDVDGHTHGLSLALLVLDGTRAEVGDWVVGHLGIATRRLGPDEAREISRARTGAERSSP